MSELVVIAREDLRELVAEACAVAVRDALAGAELGPSSPSETAIELQRLYPAEHANRLLGFSPKRMTIYDIPEADLPRCRVGPSRGATRFLGADLLAYAKGLPAPELAPMLDRARATLEDRLSSPGRVVGSVGQDGRRRRVV